MPVKIGVASVTLDLALNLAFMMPLAHVGPALATSLAAIFNVVGLGIVLNRRGHCVPDRQLWRRCIGTLGSSAVMAVTLWKLQIWLFQSPSHGWAGMAYLAGLVGTGMLAYALASLLLGGYEVQGIRRLMLRRRLRNPARSTISSAPTTET